MTPLAGALEEEDAEAMFAGTVGQGESESETGEKEMLRKERNKRPKSKARS